MTALATLPFAPLEQIALDWAHRRRMDIHPDTGANAATLAVAQLLDVQPETVCRWRREGVTVDRADRAAIDLGRHLSELWDDDDIEFALVWAAIKPGYMRRRLAKARAYSRSLRKSHLVGTGYAQATDESIVA